MKLGDRIEYLGMTFEVISERRAPKRGEWYELRGEAHKAMGDFQFVERPILRKVEPGEAQHG